jgi:hypothetical protein
LVQDVYKNLLHDLEFCKNLQSESIIQLMAEMYFYLYLLYLLSELGEILFRGCALMVLSICELHENQPQIRHTFTSIYVYHTSV